MMSFLKSLFKHAEPDISGYLKPIKEIEDVADFCFFDALGNVVLTGSEFGNSISQFTSTGKNLARASLLLSSFAQWTGSASGFWQLKSSGGNILIWNFGSSYLLVLMKNIKQIPIIRMTVNIFKETASECISFEKYFREPETAVKNMWQDDVELKNSVDFVLGNQVKETI